jgi:hypothetical protein
MTECALERTSRMRWLEFARRNPTRGENTPATMVEFVASRAMVVWCYCMAAFHIHARHYRRLCARFASGAYDEE